MTRGRKKDQTIPPTRSLTLQRDYRARKAQYVSDLESRCKAAEEENVRLRKELDFVRNGVPSVLSAQATLASNDLMQKLAETSAALTRFQQLAPSDSATSHLPSPRPIAPSFSVSSSANYNHGHGQPTPAHQVAYPRNTPSPTPSLGSNCCGGFMDCRDLVEEEEEEQPTQDHESDMTARSRTSGMRSTSGGAW